MNKYGGLTLAEILAQIVAYMHDDYNPRQSETVIPDEVIWNCAYVCACFVAQHTVNGGEGVDTGHPYEALKITDETISYAERVMLADSLIHSYGGVK